MPEFDFGDGNGLVPAHQHVNGGGWVAETATAEHTAWVGEESRVYGKASLLDTAELCSKSELCGSAIVYGKAVLRDSLVCGHARVFGLARILGGSLVRGRALVCGEAFVQGKSRVQGRAYVGGKARILNGASVDGEACVLGKVRLSGDLTFTESPLFGKHPSPWTAYRPEGDIEVTLVARGRKYDLDDYAHVTGWGELVAGLAAHFDPGPPLLGNEARSARSLRGLQIRNLEHFLKGKEVSKTSCPPISERSPGLYQFYYHPSGSHLVQLVPVNREGLVKWECSCGAEDLCEHVVGAAQEFLTSALKDAVNA